MHMAIDEAGAQEFALEVHHGDGFVVRPLGRVRLELDAEPKCATRTESASSPGAVSSFDMRWISPSRMSTVTCS
jgi:hypothetical protein